MSEVLDILGSKYPIIQGPIGELNDPKMVAAVSEAGGFGMLALGTVHDPETVKQWIAQIQDMTDKPFGANLMVAMNPNNEAILEVLAQGGVRAVTTSAGGPNRIYPKIRELGMKGLHVSLAASFAQKAAEAEVDGVVVSGMESGGLRSLGPESTNLILIPLVCDMIDLPVVAAGGIVDRRGYRAVMALGAQGVQIGTAFLASEESPATKEWKEAIIGCGDAGTALMPRGRMTYRAIINSKMAKLLASGADITEEYRAGSAGETFGAGQGTALIKEIKPVKDIIEEMVSS